MALAEPPPKILNRIHQLAALLHGRHSARTRLLPCEGFYRDARAPTFGFVFDVPTDRFHIPSTLGELLMVKSRAQRLALDSRAKLALMLSLALFQFHTVGWVHKSLRSSNVLFFPEKGADLSSVHYDEPWLVGFEYSREDPGFSENPRELDISKDIYRHPEQWGQPTRRFDKSHDIYSLGVVLLEIGLWRPASHLEDKHFHETYYTDRFEVQKLFIQAAKDKLPFMVGGAYSEVVVKCLTGHFDLSETPDGRMTQEIHQEQVRHGIYFIAQDGS
jgi:serine/threonine protein kinase